MSRFSCCEIKCKMSHKEKSWCWYCNHDFDNDNMLVEHQKEKHFKCHICHKKLYTGPGLSIHCMQVHKETIEKVPNSFPNRSNIKIEISGMDGIPAEDLKEHKRQKSEGKFELEDNEPILRLPELKMSVLPQPGMIMTNMMPTHIMGEMSQFGLTSSMATHLSTKDNSNLQLDTTITGANSLASMNTSTTHRTFMSWRKKLFIGIVRLAIMPANHPKDIFSDSQLHALMEAVLVLIVKKKAGPIKPKFYGTDLRAGYLVIGCQNDETAGWLRSNFADLELWEGADVKLEEEKDFPSTEIVTGQFPNSANKSTEMILSLIDAQNDELIVHAWRTIRRSITNQTVVLRIEVDTKSFDTLKSRSFMVSYGFRQVKLKKNRL